MCKCIRVAYQQFRHVNARANTLLFFCGIRFRTDDSVERTGHFRGCVSSAFPAELYTKLQQIAILRNVRRNTCLDDLGGIFLLSARVSREDDNAHGIAVDLVFSVHPNTYTKGEIVEASRYRARDSSGNARRRPLRVYLCGRIKDRITCRAKIRYILLRMVPIRVTVIGELLPRRYFRGASLPSPTLFFRRAD